MGARGLSRGRGVSQTGELPVRYRARGVFDVARGAWSADTQDRWFYGLLALASLAVVWLMLPFLDALLFASATVVVTWPLYVRVAERLGGRSYAAAVVTGLGIVLLVLVPVTLLAWW